MKVNLNDIDVNTALAVIAAEELHERGVWVEDAAGDTVTAEILLESINYADVHLTNIEIIDKAVNDFLEDLERCDSRIGR